MPRQSLFPTPIIHFHCPLSPQPWMSYWFKTEWGVSFTFIGAWGGRRTGSRRSGGVFIFIGARGERCEWRYPRTLPLAPYPPLPSLFPAPPPGAVLCVASLISGLSGIVAARLIALL